MVAFLSHFLAHFLFQTLLYKQYNLQYKKNVRLFARSTEHDLTLQESPSLASVIDTRQSLFFTRQRDFLPSARGFALDKEFNTRKRLSLQ
jgi:hypothetical protein